LGDLRAVVFFAGLRAVGAVARLTPLDFFAASFRNFGFATARLGDFALAAIRARDFAFFAGLRDFAFAAFLLVFAIARLLPNFVRGCEFATPIAACRRTVRKGSAFPEAISYLFP